MYRQRLTVFVLFLLFLGPFLGAMYLYSQADAANIAVRSKGALLIPPLPLTLPTSAEKSQKWLLFYYRDKGCPVSCLQKLQQLDKVRIALGKDQTRVQVALLGTGRPNLPVNIKFFSNKAANLKTGFYISDPLHQVILFYADLKQEAMYDDFKHLLKVSTIG